MKKKLTDSGRKLGLRRETLRSLVVLGPDDLVQAAGGGTTGHCTSKQSETIGSGSKFC